MNTHVTECIASLPKSARDFLLTCPRAGGGVHTWLFLCALRLHSYVSKEAMAALLRDATDDCGRDVSEREIADAIQNSRPDGKQHTREQPWPPANAEQIEAVVRGGIGVVDLWEMSPVRLSEDATTVEILETLFPNDPLLCCGWTKTRHVTARLSARRGHVGRMQFVVPSPMRAELGHRKGDGGLSPKTDDNTGPRRFLVPECDFAEKSRDGKHDTPLAPLIRRLTADGFSVADMCAAVLHELTRYRPLTLVVDSAGKSLHPWFYVYGEPEDELRRFMCVAACLGADTDLWKRSQYVRMPEGLRRKGDARLRQSVFYFDEEQLR